MYMARVFTSNGRGLVFISLAAIFCCSGIVKSEGNNRLIQISRCVCPGFDVLFTCSIVGGGNTIWNGSAFDCPSASDSNDNKIVLRHSGFGMQGNSIGMCNEGAIIGWGISVENTCYISQLSVRVNSDIVGKEVSCFYDNLTSETLIGNRMIVLTSGDDVPPPSNISLIGATPSELTFEWSSVTHDCSPLHYNIIASECGDCPTITNSTTATCSIQQLQLNEVRSCSFHVQAVLCDGIFGQSGDVNFRLKVPNSPTINAIPTYSQQNNSLLRITISFPEMPSSPFSSEISSSSYYVTYMNTTSSYICDSETIMSTSLSLCQNGVCSEEFDITSTSCFPFSQITVTVFAANVFGNGSVSNSITIDNTNNFVMVTYDKDAISIICTFLNQQDTTVKSCSIKYVQCQQKFTSTPKQLSAMNTTVPNMLQIILTFDDSDEARYCYDVEASNSSYTVHVDGTLNLEFPVEASDEMNWLLIGICISLGVMFGVICVAVTAVMIVLIIRKAGFGRPTEVIMDPVKHQEDDINMSKNIVYEQVKCRKQKIMLQDNVAYCSTIECISSI